MADGCHQLHHVGAIGIAYAAAMPCVDHERGPVAPDRREANGVNALMRVLGASVSSAVVGMVLAQYVTTLHLPTGHGTITQALITSTAYTIAVVISLVACAATVVSALALPKTAATGGLANRQCTRSAAGTGGRLTASSTVTCVLGHRLW